MRFSKTRKIGVFSGVLSFAISIPSLLITGALVSMANQGNPDFVASVAQIGFSILLLTWLILANWTSADTTLYLAIIPLKKLLPLQRGALVVLLGGGGAIVAGLGSSALIIGWLTWLSIVIPPLAGPICAEALWLFRGTPIRQSPQVGYDWRGLLPWAIGIATAATAQLLDIGSPPVIGITVSFLMSLFLHKTP